MTTLLVIGARGQVGWELVRALAPLGRVVTADRPEVDLSQPDSLRAALRKTRPTIIVNAAAYTAVDRAEQEPALAHAINGVAPGILAEEAKAIGALLVHYSTDYVFDGRAHHPYTEEDAPNPLSVYGRTKLAGEEAIRACGGAHLIVRTSGVYGVRGHNFVLTMLRLAREQAPIRVVNDQIGAPMWSRTLADITAQMLARWGDRPDQAAANGTHHVTASGETSWFGFAERIFARVGRRAGFTFKELTPIPTSAYPLPAVRPAYSVLSSAKLHRRLGLSVPSWETLLDLCLADMGL